MFSDSISKIEIEQGIIHVVINDPDSCSDLVQTIVSLIDHRIAKLISSKRERSGLCERLFSLKSPKDTLIRIHSSSNPNNQTYQLFTLKNTNIMLQLDNEFMQTLLDAKTWQNLSAELNWSASVVIMAVCSKSRTNRLRFSTSLPSEVFPVVSSPRPSTGTNSYRLSSPTTFSSASTTASAFMNGCAIR